MNPITQGNLPTSFKAIRPARGQIFDGRQRGLPSVGDSQKLITDGSTFFSMQNLTCLLSDKTITMTQESLPRSFKAIRENRLAIDHEDRCPSIINESWVNYISMGNLTWICWVKMKPLTQGNLPRRFKANRLPRGQNFDGRGRGSQFVGDAKKSITHGSTFFLGKISRAYAEIK
ncbi:uncharacterized protein G2W53_027116 [Senna tora]|uniref:Uncharacterized protein n=1 Tax=Senna tora TaxID=362788 RepID=A0A834WJF9_9FABA|nr:uncharacterized protein G2W53_027116 [Senna tora]